MSFKPGDKVRISSDLQFVKEQFRQPNLGFAFLETIMSPYLGKTGTVKGSRGSLGYLVHPDADLGGGWQAPGGWLWPDTCLSRANLLDVLIDEAVLEQDEEKTEEA